MYSMRVSLFLFFFPLSLCLPMPQYKIRLVHVLVPDFAYPVGMRAVTDTGKRLLTTRPAAAATIAAL